MFVMGPLVVAVPTVAVFVIAAKFTPNRAGKLYKEDEN
jgi:hypothetical protein